MIRMDKENIIGWMMLSLILIAIILIGWVLIFKYSPTINNTTNTTTIKEIQYIQNQTTIYKNITTNESHWKLQDLFNTYETYIFNGDLFALLVKNATGKSIGTINYTYENEYTTYNEQGTKYYTCHEDCVNRYQDYQMCCAYIGLNTNNFIDNGQRYILTETEIKILEG
jgi:hypothetical protein